MQTHRLNNFFLIGSIGLFSNACLTIPEDAPTVFHEAKSKLSDARKDDVHKVFPKSYKTASSSLEEAVDLYQTTSNLNIPVETRAQNALLAKQKANEVIQITDNARQLAKIFHDWDANISQYAAEDQLHQQALAFQQQISFLNTKQEVAKEQKGGLVEISPGLPQSFEIAGPVAFFNFNQDQVVSDFKESLQEIATFIKQNPQMKIKLIGYADPRGTKSYNKNLAYNRAKNVANALQNLGVNSQKITIESEGSVDEMRRLSGQSRYQLARRVEAIISA